ncbi:MAG: anti-sigma factor [Pseudomonadales bacterium]|nr:anti-sigma factor [Pseudomonadales bacterium]
MSREALQESLSALMDNETDELELRRVLAASGESEVRATWARYQVARAVMHKELLEPRLDLAAAVSAALADESVPAVSQPRLPWRGLGRLAVAASVTVAVLAGVRMYNQDDVATTQLAQRDALPLLQARPLQGPAVLAGYTTNSVVVPQGQGATDAQQRWQQQHLPAYVRQHAQQAAFIGTQSALPYARAASMEGR